MLRMIEKAIAPLKRRLRLLVSRGVVHRINDAPGLQELQVTALADEVLDATERMQQYGFSSHPHTDADCLLLNVGANRSHPIVIAVDDRRYRVHLTEGEVAMYDDLGQSVTLSRNGIVLIAPQGVQVTGDITVTGDVVASGISLKSHTHAGDSGGTTGAPR